jgi:hypothetical protein
MGKNAGAPCRHPGESRGPVWPSRFRNLDSGFRQNDEIRGAIESPAVNERLRKKIILSGDYEYREAGNLKLHYKGLSFDHELGLIAQ